MVRGRFENFGDPEVAQLYCVVCGQKNVLRLEVAMQNLFFVDVV